MRKKPECRHVYCLFCRTGAEERLKGEIERRIEGAHAIAGMQEKHKIINKRYEIDRRSFLPGYLFVYGNERIDFDAVLRMENIYRILGDEASAHELQGSDREFAQWMWKNDGLVGISRIGMQDGQVHVYSGPMQYFAKKLIKLDKHTKNALVRIEFLGEAREMWLAFEFEDEEIKRGRKI